MYLQLFDFSIRDRLVTKLVKLYVIYIVESNITYVYRISSCFFDDFWKINKF